MRRTLIPALLLAAAAAGCSSSPARPERQLRFGVKVAERGYWREARFRFEEAIRLRPDDAHAHGDLAVSLEALGEFSAAFEEHKKAIALAPNDRHLRQNYSRFAEFYAAYSKTVGKTGKTP
jgi:Flp pilus assembly protein TadD